MVSLPEYVPAINLLRGDVVDQRFFAIAALYDFSNDMPVKVSAIGSDNNYPFFLRSLLKPIQASIMADYGTAEYYNFSKSEIAIMQASHCGEKLHNALVLSILNKAGLNESKLLCPAIAALSPDAPVCEQNLSPVFNNCSGKHAMMLAVSKQLDFPVENYNNVNHPVQKLVFNKICSLSGYNNPPQTYDGCTLPVWALPFNAIAKAFFRLYNDTKYQFLKDAYCFDPYIIGGKDSVGFRQDTLIMKLNPNLISKTGAGGFLSIYNMLKKQFMIIKMAQDNNKVRFLFAAKLLEALGWLNPAGIEILDKNLCKNLFDYNFYDESGRIVGLYKVSEMLS